MGRGLSYIQKALLLQIFEVLEVIEKNEGLGDHNIANLEFIRYGWKRTKYDLFIWKDRESIYFRRAPCGDVPHFERKVTSRSLGRLQARELVKTYVPKHTLDGTRKRLTTRLVDLTPEGRKVAEALQESGFDRYLLDKTKELNKFMANEGD